ncbi:MAG TPA: VOC family protein [Candidatus Eisenbacteria bacterium]|jgi:catechol 2,3-dioxygenase-like lactoylglutathione lyase family enzyme
MSAPLDPPAAPPLTRVVETALYFDDLPAAAAFYHGVLGLRIMNAGERLVALDAGAGTVLLLFRRGATVDGFRWPAGFIPPHDGAGPAHVALGVAPGDLDAWGDRLAALGIAVESRVTWTRGGRSLYFRDPGGHSVELVTPGTWENY